MFNPEKKIGASLLVLGMMISGRAMAQAETTPTCVKAPTCEELGYDKVASDCGELAKLRCPFDPDKYFCTAYTDQNGKKLAEIGDFVYVDAISAEPISGRIPVGIVYDLSGKMMSIAQFTGSTSSQCASYTTDGTSGWSLASMEDMGLIKANVDKINAQLAKIPNTKKIETAKQSGGTSYEEDLSCVWKTSDGHACMKKDTAINGSASCCDMSSANTFPNYIKHALCVRSFGSGGAGNDPTPTTYIPMTKAWRLVRYLRLKPMVSTVRFYPVLPAPAHRLKPSNTATALILRPALPGGYQPISRWLRFAITKLPVMQVMLLIGQEPVIRPIIRVPTLLVL